MEISSCSCKRCRGACMHKPCFPTPEEAKRLLAEHPDKMVWDVGIYQNKVHARPIAVMRPAAIGEIAGETYDGHKVNAPCVFFKKNKCVLHDTDMKPLEGRLMSHTMNSAELSSLRGRVAMIWLTQ